MPYPSVNSGIPGGNIWDHENSFKRFKSTGSGLSYTLRAISLLLNIVISHEFSHTEHTCPQPIIIAHTSYPTVSNFICSWRHSISKVRLVVTHHLESFGSRVQGSKNDMSDFIDIVCSPNSGATIILYGNNIGTVAREIAVSNKVLIFISICFRSSKISS